MTQEQAMATTRESKRVLIVDDHPIVRFGLKQILDGEDGFVVSGEAEDGDTALELIKNDPPDVAIIDVSLTGTDGIALIKTIRSSGANFPILVFSMHDEKLYAERALRAGAGGFLMKQEAADNLVNALNRVLTGNIYLSGSMEARLLQRQVRGPQREPVTAVATLSDRQIEVYRLIGEGLGTREIADKLELSVKTVESHKAQIKDKLGLKGATELAQHAIHFVSEN